MGREVIILNWIYIVIMLLLALIILIMSKNPKRVPKINYYIVFFVPIWSAICYIFFNIQQNSNIIDEQLLFIVRYIDRLIIIPLLLTSLCFTAMYYSKKDKSLISKIILVNIIMITSGLLGDLSIGVYSYIWFIISVIAFLTTIWLIWGPIEDIASTQGATIYVLYKKLSLYITVIWLIYLVIWILGPVGLEFIDKTIDIYVFMLINIISRGGLILINLVELRKLSSDNIIP
ncbi:bacteriorhodopsin [Paraclostridium bifermentans]|uniref:bacteriorhodopsin n=1 Tax=Paraclostridium bifermentans TaxID=1490 RepID=UPI00359C6B9F